MRLLELKGRRVIVVYGGGFQPFHEGHMSSYTQAKEAFPGADFYVAASNVTSERPIPFDEKKFLAQQAGVRDPFVQVGTMSYVNDAGRKVTSTPLNPLEVLKRYNPEDDVLIIVRSERDPMKTTGTSYYQPFTDTESAEGFGTHAYIFVTKKHDFSVGGETVYSGSQVRQLYGSADDAGREQIISQLYPNATNPDKVKQILDKRIGGVAEQANPVTSREKARTISPVLGKDTKQHPFKGRLVGESEAAKAGQGLEWEEKLMDIWSPKASKYMARVVKQSFNSLYPDVKLKVWAEDEGVTATTDLASTDVKADVFGQWGKKDWECNFFCGPLFNQADGRKYLELMVDDASSGSYPGVWRIIVSEWKKWASSQLQKTGADDVCFSVDQDMSGGAWAKIAQAVGIKFIAHDLDEGMSEGKIKLYTDPDYFGAEVDDTGFDSLPVVNISVNKLVGFEPDSKMRQPKSKANIKKIVVGLKNGVKLPPLLVRKYKNGYQVLDGHHRFWAYKLLKVKSIPVQIIPDSDIEEKGQKGVAEGTEIVDQDSDLDQQVYTLMVDGQKVSFTYWDYESNFQSPDIKDIYQQAREQLGKKLSPKQVKAVARAVFKSFEQGVAEASLATVRAYFAGDTDAQDEMEITKQRKYYADIKKKEEEKRKVDLEKNGYRIVRTVHEDEVDEATGLSPELLARYKKAAGADASNADKEGDFKRDNKRFSGHNSCY